MHRRGAVLVELVAALSMVAVLSATLLLQVPQQVGITPGDAIQGGFSLVVLGLVWTVYRRQDTREKEESQRRKDLHDKLDRASKEAFEHYADLREKFGRLDERAITATGMLLAQDERLDGLGSKISNQVERGMQSRLDAQDRLVDSVMLRMDNLVGKVAP